MFNFQVLGNYDDANAKIFFLLLLIDQIAYMEFKVQPTFIKRLSKFIHIYLASYTSSLCNWFDAYTKKYLLSLHRVSGLVFLMAIEEIVSV